VKRAIVRSSEATCLAVQGPDGFDRRCLVRMTSSALAAYRVFHATHAPHGPLVFGADEPALTGYRAWAASPLWHGVGLVGQRGPR